MTDSLIFEIIYKDSTKSYFQCKKAVLPRKYISWLKVFNVVYIEIFQLRLFPQNTHIWHIEVHGPVSDDRNKHNHLSGDVEKSEVNKLARIVL